MAARGGTPNGVWRRDHRRNIGAGTGLPEQLTMIRWSGFRCVTLVSGAAAWSSDWCAVCRGARFAEGPVLASLAMLARKIALRVAPGGSAPLFLSAARRGAGGARSGRESRLADRTGKRVWGATRLTMRRADGSILMRQCPIRSETFLDEAIRRSS